jgi:hypothetical protein
MEYIAYITEVPGNTHMQAQSGSFNVCVKGLRVQLDRPRKVYIKCIFDGSFKTFKTTTQKGSAELVRTSQQLECARFLSLVRAGLAR